MTIDVRTRVCGIIGKPLGHTLSPAIHNAGFRALGLNLVYLAFEVEDAAAALAAMRALDLRGLSVTIPHKTAVVPHLDEIDDVARRIGAVNTVVNEGGRLTGHNTDVSGALEAMAEAGIGVGGRSVLLLGSGGAARAVVFGIAMKLVPARIRILGVIPEELAKLTADVRDATGVPVSGGLLTDDSLRRGVEESDVLVHATPIGMHPRVDESLVPADWLRPGLAVFDVIYNPDATRLIRDARCRGLLTASGIPMFLHQAAEQFRLFTGREAPLDVMRQVLVDHFARPGAT